MECVYLDFKYPGYELYPGFDHIGDMVFTSPQRNLDIHILVCMIYHSIPVSDWCILFAQLCFFFLSSVKLKLIARKMKATVGCLWVEPF